MKKALRITILLLNVITGLSFSTFKVLSWNLLAPCYAKPSKFPKSQRDYLDWSYREPLILEQIRENDSSIVCLQEVQIDLWDCFSEKLNDMGYTSSLQVKSKDFPVACAILVKQDFGTITNIESRSRALIAVIQVHGIEEKPLLVASVHLDAGFGDNSNAQRFYQMKSLLKRLNHYVGANHDADNPVLVIAGDCNMIESNPVYKLMSTGKVWRGFRKLSAKSKHPLLPLQDAYKVKPPKAGPVRRTYRSGYILDYIWCSGVVQVVETWQSHPDAATNSQWAAWPGTEHPSDHLPIGATLSISTSSSTS